MLDRDHYRALCDARIFEPASLQRALRERPRRTLAGTDGNLLILAADHTAQEQTLLANCQALPAR